jgi:hypothetical protein
MNNIFVRILIIGFALFGLYKMFPQISHFVDYYIKNKTFQSSVVTPAVTAANSILPSKIQIPTPQVMGDSTDYVGDSPLQQLTSQVSSQAASLANDQLNQIKKAATNQFCQVLLEKVKTDCGVQ